MTSEQADNEQNFSHLIFGRLTRIIHDDRANEIADPSPSR